MAIYTFGNSWCKGPNIPSADRKFGDWLAAYNKTIHYNNGQTDASLLQIKENILGIVPSISEQDIVTVIYSLDTSPEIYNTLLLGIKQALDVTKCQYLFAHTSGPFEILKEFKLLLPEYIFLNIDIDIKTYLGGENSSFIESGLPNWGGQKLIGETFMSRLTDPLRIQTAESANQNHLST